MKVVALEDMAAGPADDDSEPEMEVDESDDEFEILPDSQTAQMWIDLIKKAAPDLGVPAGSVAHLNKFSHALRKAKIEKANRDLSLHAFFETKPKAKKGGPPPKS